MPRALGTILPHPTVRRAFADLTSDHYHVIALVRGQMPRISEPLTPAAASERLREMVCETRQAGGKCVGRVSAGYVEVRNGSAVGVDALERVRCWGMCQSAPN